MNRLPAIVFTLSIITFIFPVSLAQNNYSEYNFIHLQDNQFQNVEKSINYKNVMQKFTELCNEEKTDLEILHLGNSHIQAGFYSNELKSALQDYFIKDSIVGYGMLFPFEAAQTNNPGNYNVTWTGNWETCMSGEDNMNCTSGIYPIMLKTKDTTATITIRLKNPQKSKTFAFNKIQLYSKFTDSIYKVSINQQSPQHKENTVQEVTFNKNNDSLYLEIKKSDNKDSSCFQLYGLNLLHTSQSLNYHAVGVNGAKISSYLNSKYFGDHLESINPDWLILSLGTNEAYSQKFDKKTFEANLKHFIELIRARTDNCWIVLTTPGDAFWQSIYPNVNNSEARKIVIDVSKEMDCSYWDFYQIMGNVNSINKWYQQGLTSEDKLHLTPKGYRLKANLFFDAFTKLLNSHLHGDDRKTTN